MIYLFIHFFFISFEMTKKNDLNFIGFLVLICIQMYVCWSRGVNKSKYTVIDYDIFHQN